MRYVLLLGASLALASPAAAASVGAPPSSTSPGVAPIQLAQVVVRERYLAHSRPGWRRGWRDGRRWNGYTGQVCRTRVVYRMNRWGERVRRVIRTCR